MKRIIIVILILFSIFLLYSQSKEVESMIFEKYESSVVFITQALYFDSKDVSNPDIFKKIEKKYEIEILNSYFTLSSGTGFIITDDGSIVTNYHVTDNEKLSEIKEDILKGSIKEFFSKIPVNVVNYDEYDKMIKDFKNLLNNSKFYYRILINNKDNYTAELIDSNKDLDIAILKLNENIRLKPAPIGDSDSLKVGNMILTIGYPVPSSLFYAVKDFKSTMTTGIVSALRNDNWGIQHTSSISPGNSGGPLFNKHGEVIGINVGAVTTGNSLFFSIPINKFKTWIQNTQHANLLEKNKKQAVSFGKEYALNTSGSLECGNSILIKLPAGYKIFIDGNFKGNTPLLIEDLTAGNHLVRIESEFEYVQQKILVKNDIKDIFTFEPIVTKYEGKLFVSSSPSGADVFLNGKKAGTTPYINNNIFTGEHKIRIETDGYFPAEKTVKINKNLTEKLNIDLEKGYKILFKTILPKETLINITNGKDNFNFKPEERILLRSGSWTISISSKNFAEKTYSINITNKDEIIDFIPEIFKAKLIFVNLKTESKVFINDKDITASIKESAMEMDTGKYNIAIKTKGYEDYSQEIVMEKEKEEKIEIKYIADEKIAAENRYRALIASGVLFNAIGGVMVISGIVCIIVSFNKFDESSPFTSITSFDGTSTSGNNNIAYPLYIAGGILIGTGVIMEILTIVFYYNANNPPKKKTGFNVNFNKNNIELCLNMKF